MNNKKYLPSIDSLRAIAVIAVIIYHIDVNYLSGGFLGVDLFFVLSGYLISSLIFKEYRKTGTLNLVNFYVRRARRLLPAVYFMVTVALIFMVIFNGVLLKKSNLDAVFGYIYTSNWWYIFHELNYFDTFGAQSPYKHLWSLAIEEQFYMVFPLLFLFLGRGKKDGSNKLNVNFKYIIIGLISISLLTHIFLFDINNVSRVYFGTDTRAFSLLVGVLGAILFPMDKLHEKTDAKTSLIFSAVSAVSIFILVLIMIYTTEYNTWLYYGGFLLISFLCLTIIISSGKQDTLMSKILSFKPLVFIGKISYSLYLWHFPILVLTTPTSEIGNPNIFYVILRLLLIFVVAIASYALVETPIRKLGFIKYVKAILRRIKELTKNTKRGLVIGSAVTLLLFVLGLFGKGVPFISTTFVDEMEHKETQQFVTNNEQKSSENKSEEKKENSQENKNEEKKYNSLVVIGDSLAVDIGTGMQEKYPGVVIDGKISRQLKEGIAVANSYTQYNNENSAVIFQLGTNGPFTEEQLDELVKKFDKADIYFVNVKVPRAWEKNVNSLLVKAKEKYSNVELIDWYTEAAAHGEYFEPDKVHLKKAGADALVQLISQNLKRQVEIKG